MYDYDRRLRRAMEFSSPEARKKYLQNHPNADPKKHSVSERKDSGGGSSPDRTKETDRLLDQYGTKPGLERKITKLKDSARELERLENDYSKLGPDDHYSMQRKIEQSFDEYAKLLEYCTGVKAKKPWYYDR
jgi:hypothetical protein